MAACRTAGEKPKGKRRSGKKTAGRKDARSSCPAGPPTARGPRARGRAPCKWTVGGKIGNSLSAIDTRPNESQMRAKNTCRLRDGRDSRVVCSKGALGRPVCILFVQFRPFEIAELVKGIRRSTFLSSNQRAGTFGPTEITRSFPKTRVEGTKQRLSVDYNRRLQNEVNRPFCTRRDVKRKEDGR